MPRAPKVDVEIRDAIQRLVARGYGAAVIHRALLKMQSDGQLRGRVPTDRTIARLVKEFRPPDSSGDWSVANATPGEAAIVLPVLKEIVESTQGRVWPSVDLAEWIVKIATLRPDWEPWWVYSFAEIYRIFIANGQTTKPLDLTLAGAERTIDIEVNLGILKPLEMKIDPDTPEAAENYKREMEMMERGSCEQAAREPRGIDLPACK
jgi:hypothetical protein